MASVASGPLIFQAPAKINLSLRVLGKRADGFHDIESLFVPIALADELTIQRAEEFSFSCDEAGVPADESNLVVKAARLFFEQAQTQSRVGIALSKNIPHGAGLGGGSSDAAATLRALDEIFATKLGIETLVKMAAQLGSDVPFFIHGSAAKCRGRGEIVESRMFKHVLPLLLLKPPFGVPTSWAYHNLASSRELPGVRYEPQPFAWGELVNDLERPVFEKYLLLPAMKMWLLEQSEVAGALMSGSGSTLFAVLHDISGGDVLAGKARAEFGDALWSCVTEAAG